jgi:hypothetical protein
MIRQVEERINNGRRKDGYFVRLADEWIVCELIPSTGEFRRGAES